MTDLANPMSPELSQEEAAALKQAIASEKSLAKQIALAGGDRKARRKIPTLQRLLTDYGEFLRINMTRELRHTCAVKVLDMELSGHLSMQHESEVWLLGAGLFVPSGSALAYLGVSPRLGFHLIEMAYGAPNAPAKSVPTRQRLTQVEQQTLMPVLRMLLEGLRKHLFEFTEEQAAIRPLETPPILEDEQTTEAGIVTGFEVTIGSEAVRIGLVLTPRALEHIDEHAGVNTEGLDDASPGAWMRTHIAATEVNVSVDLGSVHVPMHTIAGLTSGTVLWLDRIQSESLVVSVEGQPKFLATPMQRAGAVGVKIVKRLA